MKNDEKLRLVTSCAAGLEQIAADEIVACGGELLGTAPTVIQWRGGLASAYRLCLWSRFASRIMARIAAFSVDGEKGLSHALMQVGWPEVFSPEKTFAVSATLSGDSVIGHSRYAALLVKDAVVDSFRASHDHRPDVSRNRPDLQLHLHVENSEASLYVDLSGESLHRRGYRGTTGIAPIKETLAAAVVAFSGWHRDIAADSALIDPMCGSATLLIEAALIWGDSAPGLSRTYFGFSGWSQHHPGLWQRLVDEAIAQEEARQELEWPKIVGFDCDHRMVAIARENIARAGLDDRIEVSCREIGHLRAPSPAGLLVSNLPYGERLSDREETRFLYTGVGRILQKHFTGWRCGFLLADVDVVDRLGLREEKSHRLFNGPIDCRLQVGRVKSEAEQAPLTRAAKKMQFEQGGDFANRLQKNLDTILPWAAREQIHCFRIYDRDLPDYNAAIDVYDGWILVQEYQAPSTISTEVAQKRLSVMLHCLREIFSLSRDRIWVKRRSRQQGSRQYQKNRAAARLRIVREGGRYFLVNLSNYIDTGLFLDHRPLRAQIAGMAAGRRFLNLFGYTGSATVHGAGAGATRSTTVDLSSTYLAWARKNLAVNGFCTDRHEMVEMDCMRFVETCRARYDLILIDPPTFSNTKKKGLLFDVQRHHRVLIEKAMALLEEGGTCFFSTNYSGFRIDTEVVDRFGAEDISKKTIPFDFKRKKLVHFCWKMTK